MRRKLAVILAFLFVTAGGLFGIENEVEYKAVAADVTGYTQPEEFDFSLYGIPEIANRNRTLSKDYVPSLVTVHGTNYRLETKTYEAYQNLMTGLRNAGLRQNLYIQSAYRSYYLQQTLHNNKIAKLKPIYGDKAADIAATVVARPGQSEHQLGSSIDFSLDGSLTQSFGGTTIGKWLAKSAYKYGFILRYPEGKENITGVIYEPWHFRYVGVEIAEYIYKNDLTLEEYVALALGNSSRGFLS